MSNVGAPTLPGLHRLTQLSVDELRQELRARESKRSNAAVAGTSTTPRGDLQFFDDATVTKVLKEKQKVIYGTDDRVDLFLLAAGPNRDDADSVVALFDTADLVDNGDGTSTLRTQNFGVAHNLCAGETFADQPTGAFCSGFLVAPNVVATAGHCVRATNVTSVRFVFGFRMQNSTTARTVIPNGEVYRGVSIIGRQEVAGGPDWALVRIDREVANHRPARIRRAGKIDDTQAVHVIGHPVGLPTKFAGGAAVRDNRPSEFFVANLDTYGGNSGSPVFNSDTHEVEGILVRGETDFTAQGACNVSLICPTTGCRGEDATRTTEFANLLPIAPTASRLQGRPSAVARESKHLDLFIVGHDGRVYTSWWHEGRDWSGMNDNWLSIGGIFPPGAPVSALARMSNQLDVFITGNDGRVYTSWWHEGNDWSGINDNWLSIGGIFPPGAPVCALARMSNRLDMFITGNDGRVYTSWWHEGGGWSGINDNWLSIGGIFPPGAPVTAVARRADHLDLFVVGNDGRVYTSWWHEGSGWSGVNDNWRAIGGFFPAGSRVSAVARMPNHLDLFITGSDGRVYTSWWHEGGEWSGINDNWRPIGGFFPVGAAVEALAREPNQLDLFVTGNDGRVYTSWWHEGSDWSGVNDNWRAIGGFFPIHAPIASVARMPNQLDLFVMGHDGRVYTSWWHEANDWSGVNDDWQPIGGFFPVPA